LVLLALFLADVGRVNAKFLFLIDEPQQTRGVKTPEVDFLAKQSKEYRVLPMDGDPMQYASSGIPVMFTSNPVQQRRWQDFLDNFSLASSMPDLINLRYLVMPQAQYQQDKAAMDPTRFVPVFFSPTGPVIVENRHVLPKAWLVSSAAVIGSPRDSLVFMQNPAFNPRQIALVESPPPIPMQPPNAPATFPAGEVKVLRYQGERIDLEATASANSLLVMGEKYYKGWRATVDGKVAEIYPVDYVLRGVYLTPGRHTVSFVFDPVPFKIGKYLTLGSFAIFAAALLRELLLRRRERAGTVGAPGETVAGLHCDVIK
jgi:hypothetical protein